MGQLVQRNAFFISTVFINSVIFNFSSNQPFATDRETILQLRFSWNYLKPKNPLLSANYLTTCLSEELKIIISTSMFVLLFD